MAIYNLNMAISVSKSHGVARLLPALRRHFRPRSNYHYRFLTG
jgi:hypothetical protein